MKTFLCALFGLSLAAFAAPPPPDNDNFADRISLVASGSISVKGVNAKATTQAGEPTIDGNIVDKSVWWSWIAPFSGPATITTTGSSFDTLLGIFTGTTITGLSSIAENDDANSLYTSSVTFNAIGGVPYVILVGGFNGAGGKVKVNVDVVPGGPCAYVLSPSSRAVADTASSSSVTVTTSTGCTWTAVSNDAWITVTSGANGSGNGTAAYAIAANTTLSARTGTITVAGLTHTVVQAAAPACTYAIIPAVAAFTASPITNSFTMTAGAGCAWAANPNAPWLTIQSGASGTGSGTTTYVVATNSLSNARVGTITVAGLTHTVTQEGTVPCSYSISPVTAPFASSGGTSNIVVSTLTACAWTASSPALWVTFTTTNGVGNGTVTYTVAANTTTSPRSAILTVAGNPFTVTQSAAACSYALTPTSVSVAASATSGSVAMTAGTGCAWAAASNDTWLTITSGVTGSGNGTIGYSVAANPNTAIRAGTLTIGGQTFTVNQAAAACTYSIAPTAAHYSEASGTGSISVTAGTGCAWTAVSNDGFITVNSGTPGSGNGTVGYTVSANGTASSRTGTITVAGSTFTITQDGTAPCTYGITPSSASVIYAGVTNTVAVAANTGCVWSASSGASWITLSPASGSGNGTVTYVVASNASSLSRTGTLTIAGNPFTVTQMGAPCTYSTTPSTASYTYVGGSDTVTVTATSGCPWTTSSDSSWLAVTTGATGVGNGTVTYSVAATTAPATRTGRLTIAGRTLVVTQTGAPCTFTLSPAGSSFPAFGGTGTISITASDGLCVWVASDNATWITLTATSGTGNGSLGYTVSATTSTSSRTGTITVSGQSFTVTQLGDTTVPVVTLTVPTNGSTISNVVSLTASATDDVGVSRVDFYRGAAVLIGTDITSPYALPYNTTNIANGAHTFYARGFDVAGNQGISTTNAVTVSNPVVTPSTNQWVIGFGGTGVDTGAAVVCDSAYNTYVAGRFQGSANLGCGVLTSAGGFDMFLVKFDPSGTCVWSQAFGSTGTEVAIDIALDSIGNIFLAGFFAGNGNVGGGVMTALGTQDMFIAKYSPLGAWIWSKQMGSTFNNDAAKSISVNSAGDAVITGVFEGTVNFGNGQIRTSKFNGRDMFLAKYAGTDGTCNWAFNYPQDGGGDEGAGVTFDSSNNILVTGFVNGSIDFGTGSFSSPLGLGLVWVAKFDSVATNLWTKYPTVPVVSGLQGGSSGYNLAVDGSGNVYVVGAFSFGVDFGGGSLTSQGGNFDVFLVKYNSSGTYQWAKNFPGLGSELPGLNGIAVDSSGNSVVTGVFPFNINLGSGTLTSVNQGTRDIFAGKFNSSGVNQWARSFGGVNDDSSTAIAIDLAGNSLVTGSFTGSAVFNGTTLTSSGTTDAFLLKILP